MNDPRSRAHPERAMRFPLASLLRLQFPIWLIVPLLGLMFVLGLGSGYLGTRRIANPYPCPQPVQVCADFENFWMTWDLINQHFVDPKAIQPDKLIDGAIAGMLDSLGDRGHTGYLSPAAARAEREALDGQFEGIGASIDVRDARPLIVQPIEGTPAARAGLRPGDLILEVDGENVYSIAVEELRAKLRGPQGTSVTLTIQHPGTQTPIDVTMTREEIKAPSVSWRMLPHKVALIHLNRFAARAATQMQQALTDAQAHGAEAIILDLRNNPGGLVQELLGVASQFLPAGTPVVIAQDRAGHREVYTASAGGVATRIPLVVLVNNHSASSAEILAGALQDAGRAKVIGAPTVGTGTVLRGYDLNNGGQVRIGTTQWLTPKGTVVRGKGIQPDELIDLPLGAAPLSPSQAAQFDAQALRQSEDTQLAHAIEESRSSAGT